MKLFLIILFFCFSEVYAQEIIRANPFYKASISCKALGVDSLPYAFYSFRKLSSCYSGNCVRIRRSDNTEMDFGFTSDFVDTNGIKSFISTSDAFVVSWYDQSNRNITVTQATASAQPKVATAGALIYADGHLAVQFDGVNDILYASVAIPTTNVAIFGVSKRNGTPQFTTGVILGSSVSNSYIGTLNFNTTYQVRADYNTTPFASASVGTANANLNLCAGLYNGTSILASDGTSTASATITGVLISNMDRIALGGIQRSSTVYNTGYLCEGILYLNDLTSKRTSVESNIKSYYGL